MKAVVLHGVGDVRLDEVDEPRLEAPTDAIVKLTASAICGTDLRMIRGTSQCDRANPNGAEGRHRVLRRNCDHRRYVPELVEMVRTGMVDPSTVLTQRRPVRSAIDAYKAFDRREDGWTKVELVPTGAAQNGPSASTLV